MPIPWATFPSHFCRPSDNPSRDWSFSLRHSPRLAWYSNNMEILPRSCNARNAIHVHRVGFTFSCFEDSIWQCYYRFQGGLVSFFCGKDTIHTAKIELLTCGDRVLHTMPAESSRVLSQYSDNISWVIFILCLVFRGFSTINSGRMVLRRQVSTCSLCVIRVSLQIFWHLRIGRYELGPDIVS